MDATLKKNAIVNAIRQEITRLNECLDKRYVFERSQIDSLMRLADVLNNINTEEMLYTADDAEISRDIDDLVERYMLALNPDAAEHS